MTRSTRVQLSRLSIALVAAMAMAPAFVLGQGCDIVDLDGPTFLAEDRKPSVIYSDGMVTAGPEVWGSGKVAVA